MKRNRPARIAAFVFVAGTVLVTTLALAQSKPAPATRHHPRAKTKADSGAPAQPEVSPLPARGERGEQESRPLDAGLTETKILDGGTRVFRFGEVEVEGRLRNPQLVYFLRRVRAEFAAGELGHRSFMRELSDTRHDPSF
jgi:hypothetical protein